MINQVDGVQICLQRSSFNDGAIFSPVEQATQKCPQSYVPCSQFTSVTNTVCILPAEKANGKCPITDIRLILKRDQDAFIAISKGGLESGLHGKYEKVEILAASTAAELDWIVFVSKEFDGPPITDQMQLEIEPNCQGVRFGDPSFE